MSAKKLVAYFSASGVTAGRAAQLAAAAGAGVYEIVPAQKYTPEDLDWQNKNSRTTLEMKDAACRPAVAGKLPELAGCDTLYVGFPIWWYTAPRIINTFLESIDFSGRIIFFATSGGSGIDRAVKDLKRQYPRLDIAGGRLLNGRVTGDIL